MTHSSIPSFKFDPHAHSAGALSLLRDCVGVKAGMSLLIVTEKTGSAYYDDVAPETTAALARELNLDVEIIEVECYLDGPVQIDEFIHSLLGYDHIIFFSRIGDQLRFSDLSAIPPATMCYTLARESLDSVFGTACYHGLCEVKNALDDAISNARKIHVTCPLGTDFIGTAQSDEAINDVSIKRFPMLVPSPVSCEGFNGQVVLSRFLVGTGSQYYDPYLLPLDSNVTAHIEKNRIVDFTGEKAEVEKIRQHYELVSSKFDISPYFAHSWHAGMHPGCVFENAAISDIVRWSGSAFGNPRILHFHTCGEYAPGEISWTIVDPTIMLDGVPVWENGVIYPKRIPNGEKLFDAHSRLAQLYENPLFSIGIAS